MRYLRLSLCALLGLGCGARSGVDAGGAGRPRAEGDDGGAAVPDAARDSRPVTMDCPASPASGFRVAEQRTHELTEGEASHPSLAGDGRQTFLAIEETLSDRSVVHLYELDRQGTPARRIETFDPAATPALGAHDGTFVLAYVESPSQQIVYVHAFEGDGRAIWGTSLRTGAHVYGISRPVFNGEAWVLASALPAETLLTAVTGEGTLWRGSTDPQTFPPGPHLAVDAESGRVFLLQTRDSARWLEVLDGTGALLDRIELEDVGWSLGRPTDAAWSPAPGGAPFVTAGQVDAEDGPRVRFQRYREDGSAAFAYSTPLGGRGPIVNAIALTGAPPPGYSAGYGAIVSQTGPDWTVAFHGAATFVADLTPLSDLGSLDRAVSVAPGPCGYVLAWDNLGFEEDISTALAVPE